MIDRRSLMEKAILHTGAETGFVCFAQDFAKEFQTKGDSSQNRSLFSTLVAVLKSVPEDTSKSHREILERILKIKSEQFEGVKTENLRKLINYLFCDKGTLLPGGPAGFEGYTQSDFVAYIEICRRYFLVAQDLAGKKITKDPPAKVSYKAIAKEKNPDWMTNHFSTAKELMLGNRDCAEYVLQNKKDPKFKGLAKQAESILRGEDKWERN
ncbi:MAG: hypothetical protein LBB91_09010 [Clostridiales bacterium]|nr:hypothetical protein [Clostridiales bacterium]